MINRTAHYTLAANSFARDAAASAAKAQDHLMSIVSTGRPLPIHCIKACEMQYRAAEQAALAMTYRLALIHGTAA